MRDRRMTIEQLSGRYRVKVGERSVGWGSSDKDAANTKPFFGHASAPCHPNRCGAKTTAKRKIGN